MGVFTAEALPFGVLLKAPDCWKLPFQRRLNQLGTGDYDGKDPVIAARCLS